MKPPLLELEQFAPFDDLPKFVFENQHETVFENNEIALQYLNAGHYQVYRITYLLIPESHPDRYSFIIYDIDALRFRQQKVYKVFNGQMDEIGLSRATYDIGILFSGGRVYADG
ncbi:MAG: hypothetical protein ACR2MX_10330, partial [Cyclobacteriaceae bacterium]